MPVIVIDEGPDKGRRASFRHGRDVFVGTSSESVLQLSDRDCAARQLRVFMDEEGHCFAEELSATRGVRLNGEAIEGTAVLDLGDRIEIGSTILAVKEVADERKKDKLLGLTVGGYRVIERIGRGGMGTVYKANQVNLDRIVALKILSREWSDQSFVEKFKAEARSAGALNHPNIIQVYDVGDAKVKNGVLNYFSMEFAAFGSVQEWLEGRGRLTVEEALLILLDAAAGLEFAEKKAIVHRDIKPDNLMITDARAIKIGDLGLAQRSDTEDAGDKDSKIFGTPHYVAPEQVKGEKVDHRADLYSLGATFYRILAGTTPFSGNNVKEIIVKQVREDPTPVREIEPSVPEPVAAIVHRMLRKDPAERYQHFADLIVDLKVALDQVRDAAGGPGVSSGRSRRPARGRGHPIATALVVIALAIVGMVALKLMMDQPSPVVGPTPEVPSGLTPEQQRRELDALGAFKDVELKFKGMAPSMAEVEAFRQVSSAYPETEASLEAQKAADARAAACLALSQTEARAALQQLRNQWHNTDDIARMREIRARYATWLAQWRGTPVAAEGVEDARRLDEKITAAAQEDDRFREEWKAAQPEMVRLAQERQYGALIAKVTEMLGKYTSPEILATLRETISSYERQAQALFDECMTRSDEQRRARAYAEAIAALDPALAIGVPRWVDPTRARIADLERERDAFAKSEAIRIADDECSRFEDLLDRLEAPQVLGPVATTKETYAEQRAFNLDEATRLAKGAASGFQTEVYQARIAGLVADLEAAGAFLASRKDTWGDPIPYSLPKELAALAQFKQMKHDGEIAGLAHDSRRGWMFVYSADLKSHSGSSTSRIQLADLTFSSALDLLTRPRKAGNAAGALASTAFALAYGHHPRARELIGSVDEATATGAEKAELARLRERLTSIDAQVKDELARALRLYEAKNSSEALRAARRIERRYFGTRAYEDIK